MPLFRSQGLTWSANTQIPVPMTFLDSARAMRSPQIDFLAIKLALTYNTNSTSGAIAGADLFRSLTNVLLKDAAGERVNVRGSTLRLVNQLLFGQSFRDPAYVAASVTGGTVNLFLRIPTHAIKARRGADWRLSLAELVDGGEMKLTTGAAAIGPASGATQFTITSGTFTVVANVVDELAREAKPRWTLLDYAMGQADFNYPASGGVYLAGAYAGEVAEFDASGGTPTAWGTQNVSSKNLDLLAVPSTDIQEMDLARRFAYRKNDGAVTSQKDEDVVVQDLFVPVVSPHMDGSSLETPDCTTLHYKTDATITTSNLPMFVVMAIGERAAPMTARSLGFPSVGAAEQALSKSGHVNAHDGARHHVAKVGDKAQRKLPVKV